MPDKYVYVIGPKTGHLKIGLAKSVSARFGQLQTGSPIPLTLHFSVGVQSHTAGRVEDHAHWLLHEYRASGEWFNVSAALAIEAVKEAVLSVKKLPSKITDCTSTMLSFRVPAYLAHEINTALRGGEGQSDLIRAAVYQELKRRRK